LQVEVEQASRGLSAIAELLVVHWSGGVIGLVRTLDSRLKGSQFDSRLFRFQVTTLGKLFTHVPRHQAV